MAHASKPTIHVTIAGAGIAGLTAALRLAERGCSVTIYEKSDVAGGNLGAARRPGAPADDDVHYDVYPHMFGAWYRNFWRLVKDVGLSREAAFEALPSCAWLAPGEFPRYKLLTDNGSLPTSWSNFTSGIRSLPDMFLAAYSILDLLSQDFSPDNLASRQTVNGFLGSRPYATNGMLSLHDDVIQNIWAVDSDVTSAFAYQSFAKFQFRRPSPQCRVLAGNAYDQLIKPLTDKLGSLGCAIRYGSEVTQVTVASGTATRIAVQTASGLQTVETDNLILAVPPRALAELVLTDALLAPLLAEDVALGRAPASTFLRLTGLAATAGGLGAGGKQDRIVNALPQTAELRRIVSAPIPVLYLVFKRTLPNIPRFYVTLQGSRYELTFVLVPELTETFKATVLAVAASDFYALPCDLGGANGTARDAEATGTQRRAALEAAEHEAAFLMIQSLRSYVPFNPGLGWGDAGAGCDVDWDKTFLRTNTDHLLFVNQVGSRSLCPLTHYPEIQNLYFAGDFVRNDVTIATVESAVCSGLLAARRLWERQGSGDPVEIIEPDGYPRALMAFWTVALAPYAAAAKCWSLCDELRVAAAGAPDLGEAEAAPRGLASMLADGMMKTQAAALQWCETMMSLWSPRRPG